MNFRSLTPRVPRNYLLLIAALVWTLAGGMLLLRGYLFSEAYPEYKILKITACLVGGILFFLLLFQKISRKHVNRIQNLVPDRPCAFSFFNFKSYLMMGFMISGGIFLRKSGVVSAEYLALIYITMGIPLLMSSFRFYANFFRIKIS
ncbi:MAG: hypothetical protein WAO52_13685 [Prolixibacteraceae bacterium]